jgi:hypothetical protein
VMIPINECLITANIGGLSVNAPELEQTTDSVQLGEWADGRVVGTALVGANPNLNGVFHISGGLPPSGGMIVLAADRAYYSIDTDTNTVLFNTIKRYHSLRGAA